MQVSSLACGLTMLGILALGEIIALGPRYQQMVRDEDELMSLLRRAQEKRKVASETTRLSSAL